MLEGDRRWPRAAVALCIVMGFLGTPAWAGAQQQASPTDGMVLPDASITTKAEATSLELNPAGLGFINRGELAVGLQQPTSDYEGVELEAGGVFLAGGTGRLGAGFSAQWLDRPRFGPQMAEYRKYTLGLGISSEANVAFGAAYNFFGSSDSRALDDLGTWDLGVQWRASNHVGFGARLRDLNRPFLSDEQALPMRTSLGTALRFFQGRAILDSEVSFTSDRDTLALSPRLLLEPLAGVRLFARTNFDFEFEDDQASADWTRTIVGLALNTYSLGIESAAHLAHVDDSVEMTGHSHLLWFSRDKRRSLVEPTQRWVLIDLTGGIDEHPVAPLFGAATRSFLSLMVQLDAIAEDETIAGVVFNVGQSDLGYAQIWEVRQAIAEIRAAGKETVSVLTNPTFRETYLASASDNLWLLPSVLYAPDGLSINISSYGEMLANAGIQTEFVRIASYKSAPESFTEEAPTPESLEQTTHYLDRLFERTVGAIADDRQLSAQRVEEMVDQVPYHPAQARREGLIDEAVYLDFVEQRLEERLGARARLEAGYAIDPPAEMRWGLAPEVAVVVVEGAIIRGQSGRAPFVDEMIAGSDTLTEIFDRLGRDPGVAAVVVRIDSPGGSAVASDLIYRSMRKLAERKPVVASMGNIAASGGYYVAAGADEIFASPNTLTGSIGIYAGKFSVSRLAELIGLNRTKIQRGERSGAFDVFEPFTEEQRQGLSRAITYMYQLFIQQIARTRPLSPDEIDAVGRGRIWDGVDAEQRDLVDAVGGLNDAIDRAESLAGLASGQSRSALYPEPFRPLNIGPGGVGSEALASVLGDGQRHGVDESSALANLVRQIGSAILLPALYEDGELLMMLPHVVEFD